MTGLLTRLNRGLHHSKPSWKSRSRLLGLPLLKSFRIVQRMAETLERVAAPKPSTPRSVFIFRFASTLVLWSIALGIIFSGYETRVFRPDRNARASLALGVLRHARSQGPAEFQSDGDDLRHRHVVRQLLLFLEDRSRPFLRLRDGGVAVFSAHGFHPANV